MNNNDFFLIPKSPLLNVIIHSLAYNHNIEGYTERIKQIEKKNVSVVDNLITFSDEEIDYEIYVGDVFRDDVKTKTLKKIFLYLTSKFATMNKNADKDFWCYDSEISKDKLVSLGIYSNKTSCSRNVQMHLDALKNFFVRIKEHDSNSWKTYYFFSDISSVRNGFAVTYNPDFPWESLICETIFIPREMFSLSNRAFDLGYYISVKSADKMRYSSKSLVLTAAELSFCMNLPNIKGNSNPKRTIMTPIEDSLQELKDIKFCDNTLVFPDNSKDNVRMFISEGQARITFSDEYIASLVGSRPKLSSEDGNSIESMVILVKFK